MPQYVITRTEISRRDLASDAPEALLTLNEKRTAASQVQITARWESLPPEEVLEEVVVVDEGQVAIMARDVSPWLSQKVLADYGLPSTGTSALVEIYKFQAAVYVVGLSLAKNHGLLDAELLSRLGALKNLEDTVPLVALALQREGAPCLRWWEEQAENFIDLWFSPFRVFARPSNEHSAAVGPPASKTNRHRNGPPATEPSGRTSRAEQPKDDLPMQVDQSGKTGLSGSEAPHEKLLRLEGQVSAIMSYLNLRE